MAEQMDATLSPPSEIARMMQIRVGSPTLLRKLEAFIALARNTGLTPPARTRADAFLAPATGFLWALPTFGLLIKQSPNIVSTSLLGSRSCIGMM